MKPIPVALFVYNRLEHTKRTVEALQKNDLAKESELFVFSDRWKDEADKKKVEQVRKYLKTITGFKSIEVSERETNQGLANSIIAGVTEIINKYGRIIVMEDDLVTSPFFLTYMNEALDYYEKEEKVISIHGFIYPVKSSLPETFFLRGADCWGWATWKRGWDLFEKDGSKLLKELEENKLIKQFDLDGSFHYSNMLKRQVEGKINSWAIRWYASAFLAGKLTLYPSVSLVNNIGQDDSGTHRAYKNIYDTQIANRKIKIGNVLIEENVEARKILVKYFKSLRPSFRANFRNLIKKSLPEFILSFFRKQKYGFFGNYKSWAAALADSEGYDSPVILDKVKNALLKVKAGKASYERDSVLFYDKPAASQLTNFLRDLAKQNNGTTSIVDFGGSLGSTYFKNREFLKHLDQLEWNVVEQKKFVKYGKENFENDELHFYESLDEIKQKTFPNTVLFGSSLQYLEQPYAVLKKVIDKKIKYIIIERTPFSKENQPDFITVQKVPPKIYDVSYPAWILSLNKMKNFLKSQKYKMLCETEQGKMPLNGSGSVRLYGLIFEKE